MIPNSKQIIAVLVLLIVCFSLIPRHIFAAKKRILKATTKTTYVGGSYSTAKLSRGTNSIVVSFPNTSNVKKISYTLSYRTNGMPQGVVGSVIPAGSSDARDLYFGTCSKGVCTPHYNIKNAVLLITTQLKSGAVNVKRYILKV